MRSGTSVLRLGQARCDNILECVLSLNRQEVKSYNTLVKRGPMRVEELSEVLGRHRSTASRCLARLETCGICRKRKVKMDRGGYYYVYEALPKDEVKQILRACANRWYEDKKKAIDSFLEG